MAAGQRAAQRAVQDRGRVGIRGRSSVCFQQCVLTTKDTKDTKEESSYPRLTRLPLGLLLNFNVPRMKDGIHRVINAPAESLQSPTESIRRAGLLRRPAGPVGSERGEPADLVIGLVSRPDSGRTRRFAAPAE